MFLRYIKSRQPATPSVKTVSSSHSRRRYAVVLFQHENARFHLLCQRVYASRKEQVRRANVRILFPKFIVAPCPENEM